MTKDHKSWLWPCYVRIVNWGTCFTAGRSVDFPVRNKGSVMRKNRLCFFQHLCASAGPMLACGGKENPLSCFGIRRVRHASVGDFEHINRDGSLEVANGDGMADVAQAGDCD